MSRMPMKKPASWGTVLLWSVRLLLATMLLPLVILLRGLIVLSGYALLFQLWVIRHTLEPMEADVTDWGRRLTGLPEQEPCGTCDACLVAAQPQRSEP